MKHNFGILHGVNGETKWWCTSLGVPVRYVDWRGKNDHRFWNTGWSKGFCGSKEALFKNSNEEISNCHEFVRLTVM